MGQSGAAGHERRAGCFFWKLNHRASGRGTAQRLRDGFCVRDSSRESRGETFPNLIDAKTQNKIILAHEWREGNFSQASLIKVWCQYRRRRCDGAVVTGHWRREGLACFSFHYLFARCSFPSTMLTAFAGSFSAGLRSKVRHWCGAGCWRGRYQRTLVACLVNVKCTERVFSIGEGVEKVKV